MNDSAIISHDKLKQLQALYIDSFPDKIDELRECWKQINSESSTDEALQHLRVAVHRIAGSSGSHGFDKIYALARATEKEVLGILQGEEKLSESKDPLGNGLQELINELEEEHDGYISQSETSYIDLAAKDASVAQRDNLIVLIGLMSVETSVLSGMLETRGFNVLSFETIPVAKDAISGYSPAVIVLYKDLLDDGAQQPSKINSFLSSIQSEPSLVIVSNNDGFDYRMQAVRAGAKGFFVTPVNSHSFASALDVVLEAREKNKFRVLIWEGDPDKARAMRHCLRDHFIDAIAIGEPKQLLNELANFKPDMVLVSTSSEWDASADIVRLIRMHETYFNIPIIAFADQQSSSEVAGLLHAGADEIISDLDSVTEWLPRLRDKIFRFRRSNNLIILDSLTGTLNRDAFLERVGEEINIAVRRGETICLAMIDVDRFKQINDQNGHVVGDFVLRHISDYLGKRLRRSDLVGRYAGDEFLVFLPDTELDSAYLVLDIVRKSLAAQSIEMNDVSVNVSISLGLVAVRPTHPVNVEELIIEADKRLYEAKMAGRNTLIAGVV